MSETNKIHLELTKVESDGSTKILYPQNTSDDVKIESNNPILSGDKSVENLSEFVNKAGSLYFSNGDRMVYLAETSETEGGNDTNLGKEINDQRNSEFYTWSSDKIRKSVSRFIPHYKVENLDINKIFISHTVMMFDTNNKSELKALTPDNTFNGIWKVEYTPLIINSEADDGVPSPNTKVDKAFQEWTKITLDGTTPTFIKYKRVFKDGSWGSYSQ